jgi:hypothetical protein
MLAIVLPKADEKLLSALSIQKCKDFKVYVTTGEVEEDAALEVQHGSWSQVKEEVVCILEPGAVPAPNFVGRIAKAVKRHPDFDVYHVNLTGEKAFPRKTTVKKLFKMAVLGNVPAPLSSFVFRSDVLRAKAVFKADGSLDTLPTVFSCAVVNPVRNVWLGRLDWQVPEPSTDPMDLDRKVREKLDLLKWTEDFFGDDDYPLSVGDQLQFFATEVVKLYPSYSVDDLKGMMNGFQVAQGPVRKMRALSALKSALKQRGLELQ